jgi:hypothetical protein
VHQAADPEVRIARRRGPLAVVQSDAIAPPLQESVQRKRESGVSAELPLLRSVLTRQ